MDLKPVTYICYWVCLGEQTQDYPEGLVHSSPLCAGLNSQHVGIRDQGSGAHPHHYPPSCQVVQEHYPLGHHQWVVIWKADNPCSELDMASPFRRNRNEYLWGGYGLPSSAVVLTYPCLVKSQRVQPLNELQVAFEGKCRVFTHRVKGTHKYTERHSFRKGHEFYLC